MKINITLDQREKDTIKRTIEILENQSAIYTAAVKNKSGMHHDTAQSAINLLNSYIGKEINLSHCSLIIFSEEFAKNAAIPAILTS